GPLRDPGVQGPAGRPHGGVRQPRPEDAPQGRRRRFPRRGPLATGPDHLLWVPAGAKRVSPPERPHPVQTVARKLDICGTGGLFVRFAPPVRRRPAHFSAGETRYLGKLLHGRRRESVMDDRRVGAPAALGLLIGLVGLWPSVAFAQGTGGPLVSDSRVG